MNIKTQKKLLPVIMMLFVAFCSVLFINFPPKLDMLTFNMFSLNSFVFSPKSAINALYQLQFGENKNILPSTLPQFIFHTFTDETKPAKPEKAVTIPENAGEIIEQCFGQRQGGNGDVQAGNGYILNLTQLDNQEVLAQTQKPLPFEIDFNSDQPQVLIVHTHATESYELADNGYFDPQYNARNTELEYNITKVGEVLTEKLNELGVNTIQDKTLHDYPDYTKGYERSHQTVTEYLEKYPSIKVVLDVHRDAIERDGKRVKPTTVINQTKAAQLMLISCADNGSGNIPNYKQNLIFASHLQDSLSTSYPTLMRPVLFDYRYYNQDLSTGSLLLEVGGHANTLQEACYSVSLFADCLVQVLKNNK